MNEKIIKGSDFEIETEQRTLYKSKKGNYFLTEESARNDSLTHKKCDKHDYIYECGSYCHHCSEEFRNGLYDEMERVVWDGSYPLYSRETEEYYFDYQSLIEAIEELAEENEISVSDQFPKMKFQLCEKNDLREVDDDYWEDIWYDGADLPDQVGEALDNLNKAIREHGKGFSWDAMNKAAIVDFGL